MLTTLSPGGLSVRIRALGKTSSGTRKRFRGKKAAIEAIRKKRQIIDCMMVRLIEEVSEVRERWSCIQTTRAAHELDRLACVSSRAQFMHRSLARATAEVEVLSVFGLNSCDAEIQASQSLLAKLRLEVRVSAARAHAEEKARDTAILPRRMLTA
jgi:hypothetical protein